MTRRRLLLLMTAIAALLGGTWWSRRGGFEEAAARLVATVDTRGSACAVGNAVLPVLETGTGARALAGDIAGALQVDLSALVELTDADLQRRLEARIAAEHLSGDTLPVEGWELSLTEARLYALVALDGSRT
jgi:hypothetical protein